MARLRARIHSVLLDQEMSLGQLSAELGLASPQKLTDYVNNREDLPVWTLLKIAEITGKPVWWFLDEQPDGITVEAAQVGLSNLAKIRLYVEAIESEFRQVAGQKPVDSALKRGGDSFEGKYNEGRGQVVDLSPYLARARAILVREVSQEDSGEDCPVPLPIHVSDESVEMVAQGLLSAEQDVRSGVFRAVSSESFEKVTYLSRRRHSTEE